jgi:hypothetical protein
MQADPTVTTGELERAFCAALAETAETSGEQALSAGPFCPDELVEDPLPPDTVLVEEAVSSHRRRALMAGCAFAGLVLGVCTALLS